jgi:hypothetical protein
VDCALLFPKGSPVWLGRIETQLKNKSMPPPPAAGSPEPAGWSSAGVLAGGAGPGGATADDTHRTPVAVDVYEGCPPHWRRYLSEEDGCGC